MGKDLETELISDEDFPGGRYTGVRFSQIYLWSFQNARTTQRVVLYIVLGIEVEIDIL